MKLGKKEYEWVVPVLTLLIVSVGMTALFSSSAFAATNYFNKQALFLGLGLIAAAGLAIIPIRLTFPFTYIIYVVILLPLVDSNSVSLRIPDSGIIDLALVNRLA